MGAHSDELLQLLCPPTEQWDVPQVRASAANHMHALLEALYGLTFAPVLTRTPRVRRNVRTNTGYT